MVRVALVIAVLAACGKDTPAASAPDPDDTVTCGIRVMLMGTIDDVATLAFENELDVKNTVGDANHADFKTKAGATLQPKMKPGVSDWTKSFELAPHEKTERNIAFTASAEDLDSIAIGRSGTSRLKRCVIHTTGLRE